MGKKFPAWLLTMKVTTSAGDCFPLNNMVWLKLEGCRRCGEIPMVGYLPLLRKLELVGFENVECMDDEFYGSNEANTSNGWIMFPALKRLVIGSMNCLVEWKAPVTSNAFPCLEELCISKCPKLKSIPISHLSVLVEFRMEQCDAFDELVLDNGRSPLSSLRLLHVGNCGNLASFESVQGLTSLQTLRIFYCHKLISIPRGLKFCPSLKTLLIWDCNQLTSVPEDLSELRSLTSFSILNCPNVTNFTGDILLGLTQLRSLGVSCYHEAFNSIQHIPSLDNLLSITGRNNYKSLPEHLQNLTRIKALHMWNFDGVEALPEWFGKLSALESLVIGNFPNLKYLLSATALQGLKELKIMNCPLLKESCAKGSGPEWSKISHIPKLVMDEDFRKEVARMKEHLSSVG
ncbi:hypothetical protein M5689_002129 [Euphorbia peplus]|nr:hypothetical protein M5689_002129 [Euphorbia peplus]